MHFVWKLYSATAGWRHPIAPQKKQFHSWTHIHTATHEDTIRSRLKELYRNVAVCVHVGCVYSNISWNWFLAPYLGAVVRAFPLAQAPHMHALLLQPHPFKYVQSIATQELLAHTEPEEINMPHAYLVAVDYAVSFSFNCEVFVFLMIVFVWIWTSLVLAVSQDSYLVPRLSCIGNIIWNVIFSTAPVQI